MNSIYEVDKIAYLSGTGALVISSSEGMIEDKVSAKEVTVGKTKTVEFVARGGSDNIPHEVMEKVQKNVTVGSNIGFNAKVLYGSGLLVVKREKDKETGEIKYVEQLPSDQPAIFEFIEDNNIVRQVQEICNDIACFGESYVELIFNLDRKIAMTRHKDLCCSRVSKMNDKGIIKYHGYSAKWNDDPSEDIVITPLLDSVAPINDIKIRLGQKADMRGKTVDKKENRLILQLSLPCPGRYYYARPYWWSIFESGWYDISQAIPALKKALLNNQMHIKYQVLINDSFWVDLFKAEGATDEKEKAKIRNKFYQDLNDYLAGQDAAGKALFSGFKYGNVKGEEQRSIVINKIDTEVKGGDYIDDSEAVTNVICYSMGVHPSLVGATPGKGKSINGTEARELFTIKQSLCKPERDLITLPLYVAKAVNGWDQDIHFVIPNIMLTTLDNGTGAVKVIGNEKIQ